jgi:3',5'-cyclic AMP phosphodiesterase CpdA
MTFVLAHLSDPHLGPLPKPELWDLAGKRVTGYVNWIRNRRHEYHRDVVEALVADVKRQTPDHIAVTGDLINLALPDEFMPARQWLSTLGSPSDVTLVPGNHDTYARDTRERFASAWGDYLRGDGTTGVSFPFVRRRANVALIGLSTAQPKPPFMATGTLGADQIARLEQLLPQLAAEKLFRVILIHHPLQSTSWNKRLTDAEPLIEVLKRHGAELILHGHEHTHSTMWFDGLARRIPVLGIPAASAVDDGDHDPAAYHLINIDGDGTDWHCELTTRGFRPRKPRNKPEPLAEIFELRRQVLF